MSYELTDETKPDGRPIWECRHCGRRVAGHVVAEHHCSEDEARLAVADLPCPHRGEQCGTVGCGCGGGGVPLAVFVCTLHERCTLQGTNVAGLKVKNADGNCVRPSVCLGCPDGPRPLVVSRETPA